MARWSWKPSLVPWDTLGPGLPACAFLKRALPSPARARLPLLCNATPKSTGKKAPPELSNDWIHREFISWRMLE